MLIIFILWHDILLFIQDAFKSCGLNISSHNIFGTGMEKEKEKKKMYLSLEAEEG